MLQSAIEIKIDAVIRASLEGMGYRLVRVQLSGGDGRKKLQIMAERADEAAMTVDDCADISHAISALLEVSDPIAGAYVLEVSSPGIDRPLVSERDFEKYAGFEIKLETEEMIEGRKRFRGMLEGIEGGEVRVTVEGTQYRVPYDLVARAKLVMTDALLKAHAAAGV